MSEKLMALIGGLFLISIIFISLFGASIMEAKTFNKFNQNKERATFVDALFSELRIEACK